MNPHTDFLCTLDKPLEVRMMKQAESSSLLNGDRIFVELVPCPMFTIFKIAIDVLQLALQTKVQ